MSDGMDLATAAEIADIQDDIALKMGILESLDNEGGVDTDTEESKNVTRSDLKKLRKRLRTLQAASTDNGNAESSSRDNLHDISTAEELPGSRQSQVTHSNSMNGSSSHMPLPKPEFVNRKRQRGDDDFSDDLPNLSSKSRRTTPSSAATAAPSPTGSTDSFDSLDQDDQLLDLLFGSYSREMQRDREYWKKLEERKKQEESDAALARSLSQDLGQNDGLAFTPTSAPACPSDYTQAFFRTDGTINRRSASQSTEIGRTPSATNQRELSPGGQFTTQISPEPSSSRLPMAQMKLETTNSRTTTANITPEPTMSRQSMPHIKPERCRPLVSSLNSGASNSMTPIKGSNICGNPTTSTGIKTEPVDYASPATMPGAFPGTPSYSSMGGNSVYDPVLPSTAQPLSAALTQPRYPIQTSMPPVSDPLSSPWGGSPYSDPRLYSHYADSSQTKEELQDLLKHIRPDEELTADQVPQQTQRLKVTLMPHQLSGLAWMKKMEEGTNKGGILADEMGLGKTIQSIALMLERPPPEDKHRPTLVVAPVALMHQWRRELEKMVRSRYRFNVFTLHGDTRKATWASLKAYDVVLTTYGRLASELKKKLAWEDRWKLVPDARPSTAEDCPILGERSHFHRVILDEAQNIKNRNAKTSLAASRIEADYRWALSGTPMQNNVEEMFSLIKFCRIRPYNDWQRFSRDISSGIKYGRDRREKSMVTLQALLRAILLRRTKHSKIHGQPILQLPPKTIKEERVVFLDQDELTFYKSLESQAQIQFNKFIQRGGIGRNYSHALVLLLRLRQACCHPHLVTSSKDFIQVNGLDTDKCLLNAAQLDQQAVKRLKQQDVFECPICMDVDENPSLFPCGHTLCSDCLSRLVDQAANDANGFPSCPNCRAKIDADKVTDIESFLRVHCPEREGVTPVGKNEDESDSDSDSDDESDSLDEGEDLQGFIVPDDWEEQSEPESKKKRVSKSKARKKKSKSQDMPKLKSLAQLRKEGLKNKSAKRTYLRRLRKAFQTSAKINKTLNLLEGIRNRGQNEKSIIFSNFTTFLDLLEVPLSEHKDFSKYVRYDGSMSPADRNDAVLEFTENPNCTVILVSLKAGNAGLNLTAANHVIMLDPFWNPFVEYQAADRCHRIGQRREVTVHRVLIGEANSDDPGTASDTNSPDPDSRGFTVEDRILALQESKRKLVEQALDESAGRDVARLGVRELGYLFGLNSL
ncbi:uncharacterized protein Z518_02055 [Rhinocladiella mackenziei CBS 650.93]|uniref:Rhinocladiella mackenziei CBS 650.93 unplaced genomic scaffold supercont1.2, whole genome shotgun sequence n=1 Tax=Rhinocladiella mackenziei CBS 650.93 TaxID=1442369 RepID=A0A0D2FYM0_9EURO|nr:uncharacterized protein Z518_02055 [Rhinocladiella mackenziei CBS 650.93]KIX07402.1 hypothetical protein Z518_02055 [Rhinocladiella mackenziei CBS 650.93]